MATVLAGLATEDVARLVAAAGRAEEAARAMRGTEALLRAQVDTLTAERDAARALVREYLDEGVVFFDLDTIPEMNRRAEDWLSRARALLGEAPSGDGA